MSGRKNKVYKISQSLLADWGWVYKKDDGFESFVKTINCEPKPTTEAMLNGQKFEGLVNAALDGNLCPADHEWYTPVEYLSRYLAGSVQQVHVYKYTEVDGMKFRLHGVIDYLRDGVIYDTKFSKNYHLNKYYDSPQWRMYFTLIPNAERFEFLSSDGKYVYKETYYPWQVERPVEEDIHQFLQFLTAYKLMDTYKEKWTVED